MKQAITFFAGFLTCGVIASIALATANASNRYFSNKQFVEIAEYIEGSCAATPSEKIVCKRPEARPGAAPGFRSEHTLEVDQGESKSGVTGNNK